jgi:glycosyltransferase involved in cell wall biosynthesis
MSTSLHVSFFMAAPTYGGAQKVTITIANGLAERGHDVDLVVARLEGDFVSDISEAVTVVDLNVPSVPGIGLFAGIPRLRSYLVAENPAVMFACLTHANDVAVLASLGANSSTHVAVTEHLAFGADTELKKRITSTMAKYLYRYADDVVTVSAGVAESVAANTRVAIADTTVLHNPIHVEEVKREAAASVDHEWFGSTEVSPIVSVGRLEPQKSLTTLLSAFARVHDARPETRLVVVGKGSERDRLIDRTERLGLSDVVDFPGFVDNPYAYMKGASVFALSSEFEGLPTVLIEALACGCTIVSTDCPHGPREILDDGTYGRLTPVGDSDALADGILQALDDPTPVERCLERADHFSMANSLDRYETYIRNVSDAR